MSDHDIKILAIGVVWFVVGCICGFFIGKRKLIKMKEEENKTIVTCMLLGGFGNNLFIMLATISYSLRHKIDYCIPTVIENQHYEGQKVFYSPKIKYKDIHFGEEHGRITVHTEQSFTYEEIPKYDCDILLLRGYYQSPKYFIEYLPQLKRLLGLDCNTKRSYTCAIHVRRGDYLNLPSIHPVITIEYISAAIRRLSSIYKNGMNWTFKFYSDDIAWCKSIAPELFLSGVSGCEFSENKTEEEDFRDMIGCRHFIISNSSFSLLAAILSESPDKVVFAPQKWFGENLNHDTRDLLPPEFILI